MDEMRRVLEELLAAQVLDIALRLEARNVRGEGPVPETFLREAVSLVRQNREGILEALRAPAPEEQPVELKAGSNANLAAAKRMSKKQQRYDLKGGLF
ncbi:MAG: hypothetical protein RBU45_23085 [Myxococcota bacterium]|jgi:hypothetical protein|nr:hypothetical protein [Myxococcota bacterium]